MNRTKILVAFAAVMLAGLLLAATGCGTSDYVQSVTITANATSTGGDTYNLIGIGGTLQLIVNANYHSGKTIPVTDDVTYAVTVDTVNGVDDLGNALLPPPSSITYSSTGMLTAVDPPVCTWVDVGGATTPSWAITGTYNVVATYRGIKSQPVFIAVASAAGVTEPNSGACGPS